MSQRISPLLFIALCCMLLASCSRASMEHATPPAPEVAPGPSAVTEPAEAPTVLSGILGIRPEELESFSYYDTPKLAERDEVAFPVDGASAVTFQCGNATLYKEEQDALTGRLAQALAEFRVGGETKASDEPRPLPAGRYFAIWPTLQSGWNPVLTFFDSGEIYVYVNDGMDGFDRYWQAENPAQFGELLSVLEGIRAGVDALPLDYQISMHLGSDYFKPESEALRLVFRNIGKDVVTAESFLLERNTEGDWQRVGEARTADLSIAPHRAYTRYAIDLTAIPHAREPGTYRVTGTLRANLETLPLELEYTIAEDATELSSPLLPEMTPENQNYCERYISMWSQYSPFGTDFNEDNYIQEFHPFHLYAMMALAEGKYDEYLDEYGVHVPGELLEDMIMRHFLFTAEQIRAQMPAKEENSTEYYDPGTDTYHFEGGYGGGGYNAVVSDSRRQDNLLVLTCRWYDYEDNFQFSQQLTLRLGEGEYHFVYVAGHLLENMQ